MSEPGVQTLLSEMEQELRAMGLTKMQVIKQMAEFADEFAMQAPYGRHRVLRIIDGGKQMGAIAK